MLMRLGAWRGALSLLAGALAAPSGSAQTIAVPRVAVTVQAIRVHGAGLERNLEGNSADRSVFVLLPPGYAANLGRRYPTVYFLHGFTAHAADYVTMASGLAAQAGRGHPMIAVLPDAYTRHGGAMYASSPTTGDFEAFVARDLVTYIDRHYRTIPRPEARGLAGHSMGGYGTWKIGMHYPGVFSSLYTMSACCVVVRDITPEAGRAAEAMTLDQALAADFRTRALFASAAAWSPAPDKPPLYLELPTRNGVIRHDILARWAANAPMAMLPQYLPALRSYRAIGVEVGDKDTLAASNRVMHEELLRFGIRHSWQVFDGDHMNRLDQRIAEHMLPFFAAHLAVR